MSEAEITTGPPEPTAAAVRPGFPWISLLVCLVFSYGAALPLLHYPPDGWYRALERPWFQPDDAWMGWVWLVLLGLNGFSLWRVWNAPRGRWWASILFLLQWALAAAWLPMLFGAHELGLSLSVLALLCMFALFTQRRFTRVDRLAGGLMWPYLFWLAWMLLLNGFLLWYNV